MRIPPRPADPRAQSGRGNASAAATARAVAPEGLYDAASVFAIAAFSVYVVAALEGVGGRALSIVFPAGCFIIAIIAYVRSPATYFAFTWWTWLLTPLIRRVFDLRYGFHATSPLLLAPLLVTLVSGFTMVRRRRMLRGSAYTPFIVAIAALAYAFMIGVVKQSVSAATYDLLTWIAPLLFGLHLALEWRDQPRTRVVLASSVLVGLLVTSLYALVQFVNPPMWDRAWVVNAEMYSVGVPVPFLIRVFSTLNAPGPFSVMLIFSLLIGLSAPQRWRAFALAVGLVALILTKGRSAWGAFILGVLVLQFRQPVRSLPRQWFAFMAVLLLAAPVVTQPRVMGVLTRRAASLENVEADHSFKARVELTRYALKTLGSNPTGNGLGGFGGASKLLLNGKIGTALDSGPLEIFSVLGWIGGTLFLISLAGIVLPIVRARRSRFETMTGAAVATVVALVATSLFGNIFNSVSGYFFWSAVGLATAGRTYAAATELAVRFPPRPNPTGLRGPTLSPRHSAA